MKCTSRPRRQSFAPMTDLEPLGVAEGSGKLGAALKRVVALAGLDLDILGMDLDALLLGKRRDGRPLGLEPEAAFTLPAGADSQMGDAP